MSKQREALQQCRRYLEMIQSTCVVRLRELDLVIEALAEPEQEPEFWPGDVLICKEDDSKVTVVHGNRGPMQLMNGKIAIAWNDNVGGEYTIEQIKEMFYRAKESEQGAPPARKPLTDEQIDAEFDRECWVAVVFADGTKGIALDKVTARDFARAIERAHGIGDKE